MPEDESLTPLPLPEPVFYPPFNITRMSHYSLTVHDLEESLRFYTGVLGLIVTLREGPTAYLRGAEEAAHHSLILRQIPASEAVTCDCIGFRVLTEAELDKAHDWALAQGHEPHWHEAPHQGRTLRLYDPVGTRLELCAHMPVLDRVMGQGAGGQAYAKRIDHVQVLNPRVRQSMEFYAALGFRLSDVLVIDSDLEAVFLWRKGSVSDLVLMAGAGPRLHHAAYLVRTPEDILRACDRVGELGFPGMTTEEGPGRHGMDGAYFIYMRDPDGHRVELFDGHYQTIDAELPPLQYSPQDAAPPWGRPTMASWFQEGTPFAGVSQTPPEIVRFAPTMEQYVKDQM